MLLDSWEGAVDMYEVDRVRGCCEVSLSNATAFLLFFFFLLPRGAESHNGNHSSAFSRLPTLPTPESPSLRQSPDSRLPQTL